ncbi:hypothetical protein QBC32DRAFT_14628 [Pseudoneurospora amorphoporcata]|uniref:Nephrocystin 3-like N-terminal domain-containing protein n=1 Tax=Pseudoneurospora amorphoporcata TaxID=241081 RepID=A0AAN6SEW0_9PEZI|nr:hypothetical protein QBC32DRAFT_14628 [Pseudoneurospora amorphoporcata]
MKFIFGDGRMNAHLRKWSGSKPLYTAAYFSWYAGDELQKSQEGLLRSLIYQIIRQVPQVALRLLPNRSAMLKLFGVRAACDFPPWSYKELRDCMASIKTLTNDFNLAILIDGLDEFDGEHAQLIDLIKDLHRQPRIKVCVSSRPWNAFCDAFSGCPQLRMELLTEKDMEAFVHGKFEANIAFAELRQDQTTIADGLVTDIVRKSEGVFLWVSLVTNSVLDGIANGDTLTDSYRLLDELPSDLSDLYDNLWSRVESEHKGERAQLLCVMDTYSRSKPEAGSLSRLQQSSFWYSRGLPQTLLWFSVFGATSPFSAKTFARRLHSRMKGLVEIKLSGCIAYLHRTVHDWIMGRWEEIQLEGPADFDAHMALVTGLASTVHLANYGSGCCGDPSMWILLAFHHVSRVLEQYRNRSFAELDRLAHDIRDAVSKHASAISGHRRYESCWTSFGRQSCETFGFDTFAAVVGGFGLQYVRAKITAEPVYYTVEGNYKDLIWSIMFGQSRSLNLLSCLFSSLVVSNPTFDAYSDNRLTLAELWMRCALKGTRDRAALVSRLATLYDRVLESSGFN